MQDTQTYECRNCGKRCVLYCVNELLPMKCPWDGAIVHWDVAKERR